MKLNLKKIVPEDRPEDILYASSQVTIYRENNQIHVGSSKEGVLSSIQAPVDYNRYELLDLEDAVLFVFNGLDLALLDKSGMLPHVHKLDPVRIGRCITKIFPADDDNRILFGTKQGERIQFVNYDFINHTRISQTASWKATHVTDLVASDMTLYAVLDQSMIVASDMTTGETLWTRFETGTIERGIVAQNGFLVYCCQGLLKRVQGKDIHINRIRLINPSSVEHQDTRNIYITSNNRKNLGCFYTVNETLKWQVYGHKPILDSVVVKDTEGCDILLAQAEDYIAIVNLTSGFSESSLRIKNLYRLRVTGDYILLQKFKGGVTLIPGVTDDQVN